MAKSSHHGTRARYLTGCRCEQCTAANSAYSHDLRNRRKLAGLTAGPGPVELAVRSDIDALAPETRAAGMCELALALARDIDNPNLGTSHAALGRQLHAVLGSLGNRKSGGRKLATVTVLANRRTAG